MKLALYSGVTGAAFVLFIAVSLMPKTSLAQSTGEPIGLITIQCELVTVTSRWDSDERLMITTPSRPRNKMTIMGSKVGVCFAPAVAPGEAGVVIEASEGCQDIDGDTIEFETVPKNIDPKSRLAKGHYKYAMSLIDPANRALLFGCDDAKKIIDDGKKPAPPAVHEED